MNRSSEYAAMLGEQQQQQQQTASRVVDASVEWKDSYDSDDIPFEKPKRPLSAYNLCKFITIPYRM
jgi:hypothetical protein